MKALLALEDGRTFECRSFTGPGEAWGEVVFNTGMAGYQEVLTDPSYRGQLVTMTYPLIGNYGTNPDDVESDRVQVAAFLVREYQDHPSNHLSHCSLKDYLQANGVLGVTGFDTRALTRHLRTRGAMRAMISTTQLDPQSLVQRVRQEVPSMAGLELASGVSTADPYLWEKGAPLLLDTTGDWPSPKVWSQDGRLRVVAFDYGIKYNILRSLSAAGCQVLVVPAQTSADTVRALAPDGVFLSNGPGDPEPCRFAIQTIQGLLEYKPMFGICLGHQLLGLALGGRTYKLKFGHRGVNQPVKNLLTGRVEITSQNHGFAVEDTSLPAGETRITHINLNDNTVEGFKHTRLPVSSVQYHPEASPGPHDAGYLFHDFVKAMRGRA